MTIRAALYARVSTDRQEQEQTIQSQLEALRQRARDDGYEIACEFADDGCSGATLQRPGLDRLRDVVKASEIDVVLFHSPDRLARRALHQEIVLEEIRNAGVKAEFLNFEVDDSPESRMLLGMQGLFSEYERTKIVERTRRGKEHHARQGAIVGKVRVYGYRFVPRSENKRVHLEIDEEEAAVVRQMYRWLVEDGLSLRAIAMRLTDRGIPTPGGAQQWQPSVVGRHLRRTDYKGTYQYHHRRGEAPIDIPVPPIVEPGVWEAAQRQLEENSRHSARNNKPRNRYLLRGLIKCPRCGGNYTGYTQHGSRGYRCYRTDWRISSTGQKCRPGAIPAGPVEEVVWDAVSEALRNPELLREEYEKRLAEAGATDPIDAERKQVGIALKRIEGQEERLLDAYLNEAVTLDRYRAKMEELGARKAEMEAARDEIERRAQQQHASEQALEQLDRFCAEVSQGLDAMTFEERQQLLRLVVERVMVEDRRVTIETVIPTGSDDVKLRSAHPEALEE
ncbi:MAG: recombinase family protein [Chloroflexota bacterium]